MRNFCLLIPVVLMIFSLSGCDFIYRLLQKEGAEEKKIIGELVPGQTNLTVEEAQKLLKLYGYRIGNPDGKMGPQTRTAIRAFQEDNALSVNGFLDKATWAQLHVFSENKLVVDGKLNIKAVQMALNKAGFHVGKPDGRAGPMTINAIKNFQKSCGLKPDGRVGYKTLNRMAKYLQ